MGLRIGRRPAVVLLALLAVGILAGVWWWRPPTLGDGDAPPLFTEITSQAGIDFVHDPGEVGSYFFPQIMAAGAAMFDCDADGDLDLYFVNGCRYEPNAPPAADGPRNRLYQQQPDGTFTDVTERSGLGDTGYGVGVAIGDINNDGHPDLYLTNYGPDRLYLNQGDGTFTDITAQAGVDNPRWGASVCFLDFDRDGWLDIYVANYVDYYPSHPCYGPNGTQLFCDPSSFPPTADKLYRNMTGERGAPGFEDMTAASGIGAKAGPGLGVAVADFNGDGWIDIYVANDGAANFLWINLQNGTFRDEAILLGAAFDRQGRPQAGMGIGLGDLNGDERPDLFLTHLESEMNALYLSDGPMFAESAVRYGLGAPSYPFTGFGTAMLDLENDGDLDIVVVNGRVSLKSALHARAKKGKQAFWGDYAELNQIYVNDGQTFRVHQSAAETLCAEIEVSRGACVGDIDNDGDLDLLVTNTAAAPRLYRNDAAPRGHWLGVRLVDPERGRRDVVGARVRVRTERGTHVRWSGVGASYLSASDSRLHFGLGTAERTLTIDVDWPDGTLETFEGGPADRYLELARGEGRRP